MSFKSLFYKNWCIRKRYYFQSLFEILLPVLILGFLLKVKNEMPPEPNINPDVPDVHNEVIFDAYSKDYILKLDNWNVDLNVLYTPNTQLVQKVMSNVNKTLKIKSMQGFNSEEDIIKWFLDHANETDNFISYSRFYGVIFDQIISNSPDIKYTIRSSNPHTFDTGRLFPKFQVPGPMEEGEVYLREGFFQLKVAIDDAFIIELGHTPKNWTLQQFPYPNYKITPKDIRSIFIIALPLVLIFGFYKMLVTTVSVAVSESTTGLTERMKMTGASVFLLVVNWIIYSSMLYLISTFIMTILLKVSMNGSSFLSQSNFFIIWFILALYCNASVFFMLAVSSVFSNETLATSVSYIVHFLVFCASNQLMAMGNIAVITKFVTCILPSSSLGWIFETIANLEASGEGATFTSLFFTTNPTDLPIGCAIFANIIGSVFFIFIYWFIRNVKPGPYGTPKPWYFIIPSFILSKCKVEPKSGLLDDEESYADTGNDLKPLYENVSSDLEVGLKVINLKKKYGNVTAVRKVTMDIYKGQITVLLGHNGAGKTTTMGMLTGLLKPSNGSVYFKGKDIYRNLEDYQKHLGLCTQHDLLHSSLSVWEHLVFFGLLKGMTKPEAETEASSIIKRLQLNDKKNVGVKELSGGMKRKLCLGIALIGNPDLLILDEPTSGLDPESRREIWNILLKLRENRTFLLTTHFMEEADVLGDRIAIMDHGEITCYGTSLFLKKLYGAGYQLTMVVKNGDYNEIQNIIHHHIPEAVMKNKMGEQLIFTLPSTDVEHFPELFKDLEGRKEIVEMGIACTTMEDVFLKVGELSVSRKNEKEVNGGKSISGTLPGKKTFEKKEINIIKLFWQRFIALFLKNAKCTLRDWVNYMFNLLFIIAMAYLTMYTTNLNLGESLYSKPPLNLDLNIYGETQVVVTGTNAQGSLFNSFNSLVKDQGSYITSYNDSKDVISHLLDLAKDNEAKFRTSMVMAAEFNASSNKILYSSIASHSPIVAINTYYNALIKSLTKANSSQIQTVNHPYKLKTGLCSNSSIDIIQIQTIWLCFLPVLLVFSMRTFVQKQHRENSRHLKHLQLMTGVSSCTYWFAAFIWDLIVCCFYLFWAVLIFYFADSLALFNDNYLMVIVFVYFMFFFSQLWLSYVFTFMFNSESGASIFYSFISTAIGFAGMAVYYLLDGYKILKFVLKLNPFCPFLIALTKTINFLMQNFICEKCSTSSFLPFCTPDHKFIGKIFSWNDDGGFNEELIFLACDWLLFAAIIYLIECGFVPLCWNIIKTKYYFTGLTKTENGPVETDVAKEKDAVDAALQDSNSNPDFPVVVVVNDLVKKFSRSFTAVDGVSFTVRRGEVFGLLGVNGAGKSTTFNMLTGVLLPTGGNAYINDKSLNRNKNEYLSLVGYCPQFDGLMDEMTGYEHLKLFALLRGVPPKNVPDLVLGWIQLLDLEEYTNIISKKYSGGTKRKLNTAVSLIGDPQVAFLDEPTTGVDPMTRRNLWNVLKETHDRKQSIVLSSHSMEECEAVCHRLTIMANGRMQCIGNVQHLKALYGGGYTIFVKLKSEINEGQLNDLKETIIQTFGVRCILKDEHVALLQYHVDDNSYTLSCMFDKMEDLKKAKEAIEDYMVNDSNLEQVFLSFARNNCNA